MEEISIYDAIEFLIINWIGKYVSYLLIVKINIDKYLICKSYLKFNIILDI